MILRLVWTVAFGVMLVFGGVGVGMASKPLVTSDIETAYNAVLKNAQSNYQRFFQVYDDKGKRVEPQNIKNKKDQTLLLYALKKDKVKAETIKMFLEAMRYGATGKFLSKSNYGTVEFGILDEEKNGYTAMALMSALNFQDVNENTALHMIIEKVNMNEDIWMPCVDLFTQYIVKLEQQPFNKVLEGSDFTVNFICQNKTKKPLSI